MSDKEKTTGDGTGTAAVSVPMEQPDADEHTTVPNASPASDKEVASASGKWQMPKPKFQQTSGYLPQGYLKDINQAAADAKIAGSEDTTQEQAPFAAAAGTQHGPAQSALPDIEPQPDLADQLIPEEPVGADIAPQAKANSGSSFTLIVLGLIGLLLFAVIFLAAVYFLYIRPTSGDGLF